MSLSVHERFYENDLVSSRDLPPPWSYAGRCYTCGDLPWWQGTQQALARRITRFLRHHARHESCRGWVHHHRLEHNLGVRVPQYLLRAIVTNDAKGRLVMSPNYIAATQGHSFPTVVPSQRLDTTTLVAHHATSAAARQSIEQGGLQPRGRTHVHLLPGFPLNVWDQRYPAKLGDSAVVATVDVSGARRSGVNFYRSVNGYLLADASIPAEFVLAWACVDRHTEPVRVESTSAAAAPMDWE